MKHTRISSGGQIQVPSDVRRRWGTRDVLIEDLGDSLSVRPIPDDPIGAALGSLAGSRYSGNELIQMSRDEETEAEKRSRRS
jgi:bifunctional DNA-binding transcriptional regulator/antitoxin component of YhaV-PrlF toxin-antitoxin module